MRNVLDKSCRENQNTLFMFSFFFFKNRAVYKFEKYDGGREATKDDGMWRVRFACWISKVTCAHAPSHARAHARAHTHTHTEK